MHKHYNQCLNALFFCKAIIFIRKNQTFKYPGMGCRQLTLVNIAFVKYCICNIN